MVKTLVNNPATYTEERYNAAHIHIHIESVLCVKIFCSLNTSENTLLSSLRKTCDITSKHNYPSDPHWEKPHWIRACVPLLVLFCTICVYQSGYHSKIRTLETLREKGDIYTPIYTKQHQWLCEYQSSCHHRAILLDWQIDGTCLSQLICFSGIKLCILIKYCLYFFQAFEIFFFVISTFFAERGN